MNYATDERYMRRALRLAALGRHASPNPMVGCVIVGADDRIVGEGFHPEAGNPHAEVFALRSAGTRAAGATAYVTLEPCAHHGRTPPCANALLDAGVTRVVAAMPDPDPRVSGQGFARLAAAGVAVTIGILETQAQELNAAYLKHRMTGIPWIVLKTAMTLDGKIATRTGDSRWITAPLARAAVHRQLRDRCDAILTGVGTVLADDPSLTTRLTHKTGRNPWRIIVDSRCRSPIDAQVVTQACQDGKTIIATTASANASAAEKLLVAGCHLLFCETDNAGRVALPDLLARLGTRGDIISVLVEGGGTLAENVLSAKLADRWLSFIAPKIAGGRDAPGPVGGSGIAQMADAQVVRFQQIRRCGTDIVIDARFG